MGPAIVQQVAKGKGFNVNVTSLAKGTRRILFQDLSISQLILNSNMLSS